MHGWGGIQLRRIYHLTAMQAVRLPPEQLKGRGHGAGMIFGYGLNMKSKKDIFKDILISSETSCVLKIKLRGASNPIITAVEQVRNNQILLKPTCLYGYRLRKRNIQLPDIEDVTRYKTNFNSPLFRKIRYIKNNIAEMRQDFHAFSDEYSSLCQHNA